MEAKTKSAATFGTHRLFTHASTEYVLSLRDDAHTLHLRLCNGTSTWTGGLPAERLTPPKTMTATEFRARLVASLRGRDAKAATSQSGDGSSAPDAGDVLAVDWAGAEAMRLRWKATMLDPELNVTISLQQEVELVADLLPGEGLRNLLAELVGEVQGLQHDAGEHARRTAEVREQMAALDGVAARLETVQREGEDERSGRRATFLGLLNRKKRRAGALNDALNDDFERDDLDGKDGRPDEEEEEEVEIPEGPAVAPEPAAAAGEGGGIQQDEDDDALDLL